MIRSLFLRGRTFTFEVDLDWFVILLRARKVVDSFGKWVGLSRKAEVFDVPG